MNASRMRRLLAGATAACALLVVLPGAAVAANAMWSTTGPVDVTLLGPITLKYGNDTYTCPVTGPTTSMPDSVYVTNAGELTSGGVSSTWGLSYSSSDCMGSNGAGLLIRFLPHMRQMEAIKTGSVYSLTASKAMDLVSWPSYFNTGYPTPAANYTATVLNGNASGPAVIKFVNAPIAGNSLVKFSAMFYMRSALTGAPIYLL